MNKSFWTLFKNSDEGRRAIDLFNPEGKQDAEWIQGIFSIFKKFEPDADVSLLVEFLYLIEDNNILFGWEDIPHPFFVPMLYPRRFDVFRRNCEVLGIELPSIPKVRDYFQFLLYYLDICNAVETFRSKNNLTPSEVCACIYYYAPMELDSDGIKEMELPRPTNIWLTGASKQDIKMLEERNMEYTGTWACNEKTRPGDIVVLYATAPYSCIHSI